MPAQLETRFWNNLLGISAGRDLEALKGLRAVGSACPAYQVPGIYFTLFSSSPFGGVKKGGRMLGGE